MAGFEVDAIESCEPGFEKVIVARVEQVAPHPDADRLRVCDVSTGSGMSTVVCGADNVAVGGCFPLALPGAILPDGSDIKETMLKGINSAGMLCSGHELGLSADSEQLFELHGDAEPGTNFAEYLGLNDHVFEISITPNRGDCFCIAGVAREIAVLNNLPLNAVEEKAIVEGIDESRRVSLQSASACPRYAGRIIGGVDISKRAPDWILERLRRADIRCINAVVDLANYVMLEMGQPMHAFDNDKLKGEIVVRLTREGEELTLLDGENYHLQENSLLITDDSGPIALAGIMGGLDTAVSANTQHIFLESAYFNPEAIAGRARAYGLHTDASLRYERGVDFKLQERALDRLTQLIIEVCGGNAGPLVLAEDINSLPLRPSIALEPVKVSRLLGVDIEAKRVKQILQQLGLGIEENAAGMVVSVPSFRFDVSIEADLIEEVARIYGYDNMPSTPPLASLRMHNGSSDDSLTELQHCLLNRGYHEIISYSFVDKNLQEKILGAFKAIPLLNPISSDLGVMRGSLLPGLLGALAYNHNRQQERIRLFECGRVFRDEGEVMQDIMIGGIISGETMQKQWDSDSTSSDIYDIKSDVEALIQLGNGADNIEYRTFQHNALHSGQSAQIFIKNQLIGIIGALQPMLLREYGLTQPALVFELYLKRISAKKPLKFTKISKFPVVKRDISLLIEQKFPVHEVMNCIKNEAQTLLSNLELFDLYQGEGIDLGKKSLALGLTFQTSSSTLTEEEVESVMNRIVTALYSEFGATLRE